MEYDLLFIITDPESWKNDTQKGRYQPESLKEEGFIKCIDENDIQDYLNSLEDKEQTLLLIVIDPLRIKSSIKKTHENGLRMIHLMGSLELDAVIDKIKIGPNKKGSFSFSVRHYD